MAIYIGWGLIVFAASLVADLIINSKNQEDMSKHLGQILVIVIAWILGCLMVEHHNVSFLYVVNTIMAGKFIGTMFSGRPWN